MASSIRSQQTQAHKQIASAASELTAQILEHIVLGRVWYEDFDNLVKQQDATLAGIKERAARHKWESLVCAFCEQWPDAPVDSGYSWPSQAQCQAAIEARGIRY